LRGHFQKNYWAAKKDVVFDLNRGQLSKGGLRPGQFAVAVLQLRFTGLMIILFIVVPGEDSNFFSRLQPAAVHFNRRLFCRLIPLPWLRN